MAGVVTDEFGLLVCFEVWTVRHGPACRAGAGELATIFTMTVTRLAQGTLQAKGHCTAETGAGERLSHVFHDPPARVSHI